MRPDRDAWIFRGTNWLAEMADCTRAGVGAIIVGPDKRFWGMGYNGTRPGAPGCLDGACPRGRHAKAQEPVGQYCPTVGYDGEPEGSVHLCSDCRFTFDCLCGDIWPCPSAVEPGSSYDTGPGACISSHAEMNAKNDALRRHGGDLAGCLMYINREPCEGCIREMRNSTRMSAMLWNDGTQEGIVALP